jgi:carbon monoxide dehydrogenase subunit G
MELSGNQLMAAPRHAVWEALLDPRTLQRCIPGCEEVVRVSDEETRLRLLVKLGPVRARFTGKMFMSDVEPAKRCKLSFEGVGGAAGSARGVSDVELADEEGGTRLTYSVAASVGGKLGQIGGRLIDSSAKKMADDFFLALRQQIGEDGQTATAGVADDEAASEPDMRVPQEQIAASAGAPRPARASASALHVPASSPHAAGGSPGVAAALPPSAWPAGRLLPELYRVGWFALGVITTLVLTHLS